MRCACCARGFLRWTRRWDVNRYQLRNLEWLSSVARLVPYPCAWRRLHFLTRPCLVLDVTASVHDTERLELSVHVRLQERRPFPAASVCLQNSARETRSIVSLSRSSGRSRLRSAVQENKMELRAFGSWWTASTAYRVCTSKGGISHQNVIKKITSASRTPAIFLLIVMGMIDGDVMRT